MTTDLIDRLRVIRDKRTTTPADGRVINEAMTALTATPSAQAGEVFGYVHGGCFIRAENWTDQARPEGWTPVYTTPQPQGDASGPSRTAAIVQALDRAAAAVLPASMRPTPQVSGGGESVAGYIDRLGERIRRGMADVRKFGVNGSHALYMDRLADEAIEYAAALSTPRTDEPARPEKALRDALEYVGQRSDGDLATIAERAELWMRESKVLIDHRREPAPTVDGGVRS